MGRFAAGTPNANTIFIQGVDLNEILLKLIASVVGFS